MTIRTAPEAPATAGALGLPSEAAPAAARAVLTSGPDMTDPYRRPVVLLVVDCPHCGRLHIHSGGHAEAVRYGERRARCAGRDTGDLRYDLQEAAA